MPGPAGLWTLLYDAECGFCMWLVTVIQAWDRRGRVVARSIQSADGQALLADLTPEERLASMHVVDPDGRRESAGAGLAPLLRLLPGGGPPASVLDKAPGATARGYDWIAEHRVGLSKLVPSALKRRARERLG